MLIIVSSSFFGNEDACINNARITHIHIKMSKIKLARIKVMHTLFAKVGRGRNERAMTNAHMHVIRDTLKSSSYIKPKDC